MNGRPKTVSVEKLWNASYIYLLCLNIILSSSFQMVGPALSKYVTSIGGDLAIGGIIVGVYAVVALFARPLSGAIADNFNMKHVMVISTAATACSVICYSISKSIPLLILFRIIHGVSFSVNSTTNIAFASSFIPKDRLAEGIGYLGLGYIVAIAFSPSIGLMLAERFGFRGLFITSSAMAWLAAAMMSFMRYKFEKRDNRSKKQTFRLSDFIAIKLLPICIFGVLFSICNGAISSFIAILGDERNIPGIGLYFTVNALMLLLVRPVAGKLNDKKGISAVAIPSFISASFSFFLLARAYSIWMVASAAVFMAMGHGAGQPSFQAECIKRLPDKRGVAVSTYYIGMDIGNSLGSIIGGTVLNAYGFSAMYGGAGVLMFLGMFGFIVFRRYDKLARS